MTTTESSTISWGICPSERELKFPPENEINELEDRLQAIYEESLKREGPEVSAKIWGVILSISGEENPETLHKAIKTSESILNKKPVELPVPYQPNLKREPVILSPEMEKRIDLEKVLGSHYQQIVQELQNSLNIEKCNRAIKKLDRSIAENLDDPQFSELDRSLKRIRRSSDYKTRSVLHFAMGNLKEALADEWICESINCEMKPRPDYCFLKYPSYTYVEALNDGHVYSTVVSGVGSIIFGNREKGIDQLNLAASAGSSQALLLLMALGKAIPKPMKCRPNDSKSNENETIFASLKDLFQQQEYERLITEVNAFLTKADLEDWEGRFFLHLRGAAKAVLKDFPGAIADYDRAGYHHEWLIERAIIKTLANDFEGAKNDLRSMPSNRGYEFEKPVDPHIFAAYNFEPWKTRAMMIQILLGVGRL